MSGRVKVAPVIEFVVAHTDFQLDRSDEEAVELLVEEYIKSLIADLAIPLNFTLSIKKLAPTEVNACAPFEVSINKKRCRFTCSPQPALDSHRKTVASAIMEVIYRNRALLIDQEISQLISEKFISKANTALGQLSIDQLPDLLTTMVKRGFSLRRLEDFIPNQAIPERDFQRYFDSIIAAVDSTGLEISHNPLFPYLPHYLELDSEEVNAFDFMRNHLFQKLGMVFPRMSEIINPKFADSEFQIQINDVKGPIVSGLAQGEVLVNETKEKLSKQGITGRRAIHPDDGTECTIVSATDAEKCKAAGIAACTPAQFWILYLSQQLTLHASNFLTRDLVESHLDSLRTAYPTLVSAVSKRYDLSLLTWILRDLLDEGVSIKNLKGILDHLLLVGGTTQVDSSKYIVVNPEGTYLVASDEEELANVGHIDYAQFIRETALKRYLSYRYGGHDKILSVYLLGPKLETKIRNLKGCRLREVPENQHREIVDTICREVDNRLPTVGTPVILTTSDIRRLLRELIAIELPYLAVLSFHEVSPELTIEPIATITLD